jgi:hypothetical protein
MGNKFVRGHLSSTATTFMLQNKVRPTVPLVLLHFHLSPLFGLAPATCAAQLAETVASVYLKGAVEAGKNRVQGRAIKSDEIYSLEKRHGGGLLNKKQVGGEKIRLDVNGLEQRKSYLNGEKRKANWGAANWRIFPVLGAVAPRDVIKYDDLRHRGSLVTSQKMWDP